MSVLSSSVFALRIHFARGQCLHGVLLHPTTSLTTRASVGSSLDTLLLPPHPRTPVNMRLFALVLDLVVDPHCIDLHRQRLGGWLQDPAAPRREKLNVEQRHSMACIGDPGACSPISLDATTILATTRFMSTKQHPPTSATRFHQEVQLTLSSFTLPPIQVKDELMT